MLESFYKIKTRILSNRLIRTLEEVLSDEQHGFRPGRSTQSCSLPFMEAIQEAERTGKLIKLLAVDIKAAFDTTVPGLKFFFFFFFFFALWAYSYIISGAGVVSGTPHPAV